MRFAKTTFSRRIGRLPVLVGFILASGIGLRAQKTSSEPPKPDRGDTVKLDRFVVGDTKEEEIDPTGMDGQEAQMNEPPFSNDLLANGQATDDVSPQLNEEMTLIAVPSPADLATGVNRVNLRGFPTPRLRNGFAQTGVPEILGTSIERVELIQGPITPVVGKAAPGGIQNFVTFRPQGKKQSRVSGIVGLEHTQEDWQFRAETTGPLIPKKLWHRIAVGWQEHSGPQDLADMRVKFVSGSLTYRHSRAASLMLILDYQELTGNPAPGVVEYRPSASEKIVGPYLPLAYFHAYGPNAGIRKQIASASLQFEGQMGRHISARASVQGWTRDLKEERFTTSQYLLDTKKFGGTREPMHIEQPLQILTFAGEATGRFAVRKTDHKITLDVSTTLSDYTREQRALTEADRALLPDNVRTFDPAAPNYYRPAYSPTLYRRILTDRDEVTEYSAIALSERAAFWNGRLVATLGAHGDFVTLDVADRRPGTKTPQLHDAVTELTYHGGANYQVKPGKLLVFANVSTAFEPSTRVDARTGRIQDSEKTLGYETGAKAMLFDKRLSVTVLAFRFFNQNISRRNPLYDDPIADAAQTQPQLVSGGEERFTGGTIDLKAALTKTWTVTGRATFTEAITTASPDIPEEVGRELTRLPRATAGLSSRYAFSSGRWKGFSFTVSLTYVSDFVANYENATRRSLAYPSYTLIALNGGYTWRTQGKRPLTQTIGLGVRNLFDRDLTVLLARPGSGREIGANYTLAF